MRNTLSTSALLIAVLASTHALADAPTIQQGEFGVSFGIPSGGGATIGGSYFVVRTGAIILELGLAVPFSGGNATVAVDGGYRVYVKSEHSPALIVQPGLSLTNMGGGGGGGRQVIVSLGCGVGAEYFVAPRFSVGGLLMLSLTFTNPATLSTGKTGLFAAFYF